LLLLIADKLQVCVTMGFSNCRHADEYTRSKHLQVSSGLARQ
jgi:hypothetical protein